MDGKTQGIAMLGAGMVLDVLGIGLLVIGLGVFDDDGALNFLLIAPGGLLMGLSGVLVVLGARKIKEQREGF